MLLEKKERNPSKKLNRYSSFLIFSQYVKKSSPNNSRIMNKLNYLDCDK